VTHAASPDWIQVSLLLAVISSAFYLLMRKKG
jgi:hypothetical protein